MGELVLLLSPWALVALAAYAAGFVRLGLPRKAPPPAAADETVPFAASVASMRTAAPAAMMTEGERALAAEAFAPFEAATAAVHGLVAKLSADPAFTRVFGVPLVSISDAFVAGLAVRSLSFPIPGAEGEDCPRDGACCRFLLKAGLRGRHTASFAIEGVHGTLGTFETPLPDVSSLASGARAMMASYAARAMDLPRGKRVVSLATA